MIEFPDGVAEVFSSGGGWALLVVSGKNARGNSEYLPFSSFRFFFVSIHIYMDGARASLESLFYEGAQSFPFVN